MHMQALDQWQKKAQMCIQVKQWKTARMCVWAQHSRGDLQVELMQIVQGSVGRGESCARHRPNLALTGFLSVSVRDQYTGAATVDSHFISQPQWIHMISRITPKPARTPRR